MSSLTHLFLDLDYPNWNIEDMQDNIIGTGETVQEAINNAKPNMPSNVIISLMDGGNHVYMSQPPEHLITGIFELIEELSSLAGMNVIPIFDLNSNFKGYKMELRE